MRRRDVYYGRIIEMGLVSGKIALVTGGASGLGRACAETLAREGAQVVVTDIDTDGMAATVANIEAAGGTAFSLGHDTTDEDAWHDLGRLAAAERG